MTVADRPAMLEEAVGADVGPKSAMSAAASSVERPCPHIRIQATRGWASLQLGELWAYRELLIFLAWRDVKVRYKQTVLGFAWAILVPLLTMVVFNVLFDLLMGRQGKPTIPG